MLARAEKLEESLRRAGLSDEQIAQLRGDNPRDGHAWQRAAKAVGQEFSAKVADKMHPAATKFALEGASNPKEFAYRYEYYHALFDEEVANLRNAPETPEQPRIPKKRVPVVAADNLLQRDVFAQLEADLEEVRNNRSGTASIDPKTPDTEIDQAVRERAGEISMGNELSAAYHVRKHYREIPQIEQTGNPVADYHNSAERTIREGELTDRIKRDGGGEILNYRREVVETDGTGAERVRILRAVVVVAPNGDLIMPTYGAIRG